MLAEACPERIRRAARFAIKVQKILDLWLRHNMDLVHVSLRRKVRD